VIALVSGFFLFSRMGAEFLPELNEGSIVVMVHRNVNIGIDTAVEQQRHTEKIISTFAEVKQVFSRIGTAEAATDPMGIHLTDTFIMLNDYKEWPLIEGQKRNKDTLAEAIVKKLQEEFPEQELILTQPIQMRFNELLEGTRADISVKIFSDDLKELLEVSRKSEELLKEVPGAGDVEAEMSDTSPILRISPKNAMLAKFGIGNDSVLEAISTAVGGKEVGFLYAGVRRHPIVIRLNDKQRANIDTLKNIPVEVGPNLTMKLGELAAIDFTEGFSTIIREDGKRRAAVLINPRGRDTQSFVEDAKQVLEKNVKLPEGTYFEWGGNFKNLELAKEKLMLLVPIVLCLVFVMIFVVFKSTVQTILIFTGIPFALVGGVLALHFKGLPFSISVAIGFIALSGIAILNGVVLISTFNQLKEQKLLGQELVFKGALMRLRPVLMTAFVDVFGFLPMMLSHGIGSEVQKPLATVVIGGITSSTLLTLVVLPVLYSLFAEKSEKL